MDNYVNLHSHSYYSVLDGMPSPLEYMQRAKELGMPAMAITDHGVLSGHREFQQAAQETGIKPILGVEAYYTDDMSDNRPQKDREPGNYVYNHMTVLAKNATGLKTLGRLSNLAYTKGFYIKPRMGKELLFNDHEGIIVLSGCMSGIIAKDIEREDYESAARHAQEWKDEFGDDFFIEVMSSNEAELNHQLLKIADDIGIKPVMTQDSHYAWKDDLWVEEAMLILAVGNIKKNKDFDFAKSQSMEALERFNYLYPDRRMTFEQIEIYVRDYETEVKKFAEQGITRTDIYENTLAIAESVGEYPYYQGVDLLPRPKTQDPDQLLRRKAMLGLKNRGLYDNQDAIDRVNEELKVISQMGMSSYFLVVYEIVDFAKSSKIRMSPGRGSGCASIVNYALGTTNINPLVYNLEFFRFLDPTRPDYPDIDLDFMDSRRHEVKEFVRKKFLNVASISTFTPFKDKMVIKDAARVYGVPLGAVNKVMKEIDTWDEFLVSPKVAEFRTKYPEVIKLAERLRGRIRSRGVHAGGIVISKEPISDYAPMQTETDPDNKSGPRIPVVGYDMKQVADIGMIKFDLLGVKGLSVIDDAIKMVKDHRGIDIDIDNIPLDCKPVYESLSNGYTKGIFQVDQSAYTSLIKTMGGVHNFDELAASNALVRPGASKSTIAKDYIARKNGRAFDYIHPDVKAFTSDTYGVCVFQEQQMHLCVHLAGLSMEDANGVRKAVGKKIPEMLALYKDRFIDGAEKKVSRSKAEKIWKDLEASGNYAFNKAHSVGYSMLTYQMAWLKEYYPLEFMCAALMHEDDKDKKVDFLMEAKRLGLRIVLPHINTSEPNFSIGADERGEFIRIGLENVKFIGKAAARKIVETRPFESFADFKQRAAAKYSGINQNVINSVQAIGAAVFSDNPLRGDERDNFYEYLGIPSFQLSHVPDHIRQQMTPLDEFDPQIAFFCIGLVRDITKKPGWARISILDESAAVEVFIDPNEPIIEGHMYLFLISSNSVVRYVEVEDFIEGKDEFLWKYFNASEELFEQLGNRVRVVSFKSRRYGNGQQMANIVFADHNKELISAVVFNDKFASAQNRCIPGVVVEAQFGEGKNGSTVLRSIR